MIRLSLIPNLGHYFDETSKQQVQENAAAMQYGSLSNYQITQIREILLDLEQTI